MVLGPSQGVRSLPNSDNKTLTWGFGGAPGGTQTPNLLIRRSRRIVQGRPLRSVRWADIAPPSAPVGRRLAAWQQYWQQSRPNGTDPRPSANAGHIPQVAAPCERVAVSPVAVACRWLLLLLSRLLSAQVLHDGYLFPVKTAQGHRPASGPPPLALAGLGRMRMHLSLAWASRSLSGASGC